MSHALRALQSKDVPRQVAWRAIPMRQTHAECASCSLKLNVPSPADTASPAAQILPTNTNIPDPAHSAASLRHPPKILALFRSSRPESPPKISKAANLPRVRSHKSFDTPRASASKFPSPASFPRNTAAARLPSRRPYSSSARAEKRLLPFPSEKRDQTPAPSRRAASSSSPKPSRQTYPNPQQAQFGPARPSAFDLPPLHPPPRSPTHASYPRAKHPPPFRAVPAFPNIRSSPKSAPQI